MPGQTGGSYQFDIYLPSDQSVPSLKWVMFAKNLFTNMPLNKQNWGNG
jgi:hypothetical protein